MSPGKRSKFEKPTGSVEASSSQNSFSQEMKPTRQSARLLKKAAPQDSDVHTGEDGQKGIHNTPFENVKRVFRSCVGKITKKPAKKKSTKKASDTQTAKKVQQMFENELLSTIDDQAWNSVFHEAVPTINRNTGKSVVTLPFNTASEFQPQSHYQHDLAGDFYHAETVCDASRALQLDLARGFGSPKSLANVTQIKEIGTTSEVASLDPFARDQQIDPALEFDSTPPHAHAQQLDPAPDFGLPAPSTHVSNFHSEFEFGSPAPSTHDQQFHPALEFGSPPSIDYAPPYSPSLIFGLPASFTHVSNIAPAIEFGSLAPSAHVPNFNSAVEFGSPASFDYTQPNDYRLGSISSEGFQYSQQHKDIIGTASIDQVQLVDPRLQAASLLDFQDQAYKPVAGTLFPAIIDQTCIHPESSLPIPSTQASQYVYYNPQTDMSTTSAHEQTNHASATSSPAIFYHQVGKHNDSLHRECIVGHPLNGHGLPTITHQPSHYNGHHAVNIKNENASYPASFYCGKPLGKSFGTFNSLRMIASSRLADAITTYNDTGDNPVMINSTGIKMEPPPMAPYPTGRLSLAEKMEVPQGQQGITHNKDNANNWVGHGNADSVHFASQPLTAPISEHETKAESEPGTERRTANCSIEAAETGLWHWAMNRYGLYRPRGMIQVLGNGTMQWREHARARWCNAVSHTSIRGQLLAECAKLGQYTHPREKGTTAEDITAFHPDQKDWAFHQRHLRPDILHQYEKRGYRDPLYPVQIWLHHGAVVLDHQNHPILDFKNMPKTISSQVEGGLQEAITRQDSRIDVNDFRARMTFDPKGLGRLSSPCPSAISMRRSRFRWRAGYLSWTQRMGSHDIKKYLDSILPAHCKAANSTKDFRELKEHEVKRMTLENRGKHLNRAGLRKLSPAARERSDRIFRRGLRKAEIRDGIAVEACGEEEDYNDDEEMADSSTEATPPAGVDATIDVDLRQPPIAGPRRWMQDMSEEELREHRKRILQIFAPQCESWEDLDGLQKFTVDSWADLEAVGVITYGDGKKPVPDYGVIRELIKHILDGKRVSEYYLFREYDENAARLLG